MANPTPVDELSPLDQIRQAEAEITRKNVAAREQAERAIAKAHERATLLKKQAYESGTRDGQIRYKEIVSKAEEEAHAIVELAHNQATELRRREQARMEPAIQEAVSIILSLKGGGKSDES